MRAPDLDINEIAGDREIPDDVREEWDKYLECVAEGKPYRLNNFAGHLPEGYKRRNIKMLIAEGLRTQEEVNKMNPGEASSEIRSGQTTEEFWKTIDDIMEKLDLVSSYRKMIAELVEVNANRREIMQGTDNEAKAAIRKANSEIDIRIEQAVSVPIYWELRVIGYKQAPDLIA